MRAGGGYLIVTLPGGSAPPDAGSRLNFSFNVTYGGGNAVTGGFINLIARSNGRVLQFRGTPSAIAGPPASGRTTVTGNGNVADITDPANPIAIGAAQVQLDITDKNSSGSTLGVTLSQSGSVLLSSHWNGTATQQQPIDNGGVQVH